MKLTVLGSGTCVPSLTRNAPGYHLEADGMQILIDCGSGTLLQLVRAGRSYRDIDAVCITHKHPDHCADLMPLIQALLATPNFRRDKALHIIGSGEFIRHYQKIFSADLGKYLNFTVQWLTIQGELKFGPFHIVSCKTVHSHDSIAFRFESRGKSVVYTGDTDYYQAIEALARDADILVADCSFPEAMKAGGHLSAQECGLIARNAAVKKLVLSHLYPSATPGENIVQESREVFDGNVVLAEDLMVFEL